MLRSSLRIFTPQLRTTSTASLPRVPPLWEGLLWRRNFVTRPPQIALPRKSLPSFAPKSRRNARNPLKATRRRFHSNARLRDSKTPPKDSAAGAGEAPAQGLSARLKKLSREYGWTAVGVYLALSVLDFPFCFMLVRIVGTDKIGEIEHFIVSNAKKLIPQAVQDRWREYKKALQEAEIEHLGNDDISEHVEAAGWGVEEAEARNKAEASLGTQLALAYAVHKSFIFIRVPLTAAVLPKVVKVLRSWGWNIGKRRTRR